MIVMYIRQLSANSFSFVPDDTVVGTYFTFIEYIIMSSNWQLYYTGPDLRTS